MKLPMRIFGIGWWVADGSAGRNAEGIILVYLLWMRELRAQWCNAPCLKGWTRISNPLLKRRPWHRSSYIRSAEDEVVARLQVEKGLTVYITGKNSGYASKYLTVPRFGRNPSTSFAEEQKKLVRWYFRGEYLIYWGGSACRNLSFVISSNLSTIWSR